MKIMTVIVSNLIIIPTVPSDRERDTGAQKRSVLCKNIIPQITSHVDLCWGFIVTEI